MEEKKSLLEIVNERKQKKNPNTYTNATQVKSKEKPVKVKIFKHVRGK